MADFKFISRLILICLLLKPRSEGSPPDFSQFGLPVCCFPDDIQSRSIADENSLIEASTESNSTLTISSKQAMNRYIVPLDANATLLTGKQKRTANGTTIRAGHFRMPSEWDSLLRRALYQTLSPNQGNNETMDSLWSELADAPLQVIDPMTRKPHKSVTLLHNNKISGLMVSTENGIELRTSESVPSLDTVRGECNCHLVGSGETVLGYWSVGLVEPGQLEYLVYPLLHNVPTPPTTKTFHPQRRFKPSPVDLNPYIASTNDVPFQVSLDFGLNPPPVQPLFSPKQFPFRPPPPQLLYQPPALLPLPMSLPYPEWSYYGDQGKYDGYPDVGRLPYPLGAPPITRKQINEEIGLRPLLPPPRNEIEGIGPLDPYNPDHPRSIQEILFDRPRSPPPALYDEYGPPGSLPPLLGPGPNSGIYGTPRNTPQDQIIRTRTPGIYVRNRERETERPDRERPTDYPTYSRKDDSCYSSECRYKEGTRQVSLNSILAAGNNNMNEERNVFARLRNTRRLKPLASTKTTEASYVLGF